MLSIKGKEIKIGTMGANAGVFSGLNTFMSWNAHFKENAVVDDIRFSWDHSTSSMKSINILNDNDYMDAPGFFKHSTNEINTDDDHIIFPN